MSGRSCRVLGVLVAFLSFTSCSGVPEPGDESGNTLSAEATGSAPATAGALLSALPVGGGRLCNPVRFQDSGLELAVREAIGIPTGPIPARGAAEVSEIRADLMGIRSLKGIECLTGLSVLSLHTNEITDLSPIAGLVSLTALDVADNHVHDIRPLARLANMVELHLEENRIADVSSLGRLTALEQLFLSDNRLHDLTPLRSLVHVRSLTVERNAVRDIEPLTHMTNLGEVWLSGNPMSDLSPIARVSGLYSLTLTGTPTAKLATLASSTLINLDLSDNATHTLLGLPPDASLPSLKWLALDHCRLNDADVARLIPVLASRNLESLLLTDNRIKNLAPFSGTPYPNLYFNNNLITDLSPILTFPSPPVLFVDVTGNPFDCAAEAHVFASAGQIFINSDCPPPAL